MADCYRCRSYAPISSYAVLGAFAALLDPVHGGRIELEPAAFYSAERSHRPGTAVLETTFSAGSRLSRRLRGPSQPSGEIP